MKVHENRQERYKWPLSLTYLILQHQFCGGRAFIKCTRLNAALRLLCRCTAHEFDWFIILAETEPLSYDKGSMLSIDSPSL